MINTQTIESTKLAAEKLLQSKKLAAADKREITLALNTLKYVCTIGLANDITFAHAVLCNAINDARNNGGKHGR